MTACDHIRGAACYLCSDKVAWWRELRIKRGLGAEPPNAPSRRDPLPTFQPVDRRGTAGDLTDLAPDIETAAPPRPRRDFHRVAPAAAAISAERTTAPDKPFWDYERAPGNSYGKKPSTFEEAHRQRRRRFNGTADDLGRTSDGAIAAGGKPRGEGALV